MEIVSKGRYVCMAFWLGESPVDRCSLGSVVLIFLFSRLNPEFLSLTRSYACLGHMSTPFLEKEISRRYS